MVLSRDACDTYGAAKTEKFSEERGKGERKRKNRFLVRTHSIQQAPRPSYLLHDNECTTFRSLELRRTTYTIRFRHLCKCHAVGIKRRLLFSKGGRGGGATAGQRRQM